MMKSKRLLIISMCASVASGALVAVSATTANNAIAVVNATTSKTITLDANFDPSHSVLNNGAGSYTLPAIEGERSEIDFSMTSKTKIGFCDKGYFLYNTDKLDAGYELVELTIGLNNITSFNIVVGSSLYGGTYRGSVTLGSNEITKIDDYKGTTYSWAKEDGDENSYKSLTLSLENDEKDTPFDPYKDQYLFIKSITIGWSC